ncbi:hypothetical protein M3194_26870 [Paenibacillus glycanilyticus]|uniref:hypothetical protein n=1 Tax=Paenibacillus glycanilyticus TaxID=126569 RepID=UPI00203C52E7|nr:hypothetical protein [Paenibacillus glycanilyticus]MCM3630956.1 hypothetical protein [Paenibacillus glycanilyticus]
MDNVDSYPESTFFVLSGLFYVFEAFYVFHAFVLSGLFLCFSWLFYVFEAFRDFCRFGTFCVPAIKLRDTAIRFSVKTLSVSGKVKLLDNVPANRHSGLNGGELK